MAIISIVRDWGMDPSIVRFVTSNTLGEVGTSNYIYDQRFVIYDINGGPFQWATTDMVLVYSTSDEQWGFFTITSDFKSLILFSDNAGTANAPINTNITEMRALQCIQDPLGNNNLCFTYTPNAINYITSTNSATGNPPSLTASGSDTNIKMVISSKGNAANLLMAPSTSLVLQLQPNSGSNSNLASFSIPTITANRTYTFQDASGTVAFTSDITANTDFVEVTGTSQIVAENTCYLANNAATVVFTIPANFTKGKWFRICGSGAGGWQIAQSTASHQIHLLEVNSTLGVGGVVNSTNRYDGSWFVCNVANNEFVMQGTTGNPDLL